jgi:hypothetical protein
MIRSPEERRAGAIDAAVAVVRAHGFEPNSPVVVHDLNNTVVWLAPLPLVAKVSTSPLADGSRSLAREVSVAAHAAERGAPVIPPATLLPAGPHRADGLALTLWEHCPGEPIDESEFDAAGTALAQIHAALVDYPQDLPRFDEQIEEVRQVLERDDAMPALRRGDREFLLQQHAAIAEALATRRFDERPLHGEAHLGNVVRTGAGLRWFDFESACRGPVEWDASTLPEGARGAFDVDQGLLELLGRARSLCVAVWCWVQPERAPVVAEAAHVHLRLLRGAAG